MPAAITFSAFKTYVAAQKGTVLADISAAHLAGLPLWTSEAYAYCLQEVRLPEAWQGNQEYDVTDGLLDLSGVGLLQLECYTEDPRLASSGGVKVEIEFMGDAVYVLTTEGTVWARYVSRPDDFANDTAGDAMTLLKSLRQAVAHRVLFHWFTAERQHDEAKRHEDLCESELTRLDRHIPNP